MKPCVRIGFLACALVIAGGCGGGSISTPNPITVSFLVSSVNVPQDGTQVFVSILIMSTSETALVAVGGLPAGVKEKYVFSDTNPSGALEFTASPQTPLGTYPLTVKVDSAGQTASAKLTLVVTAPN